MGEHQSIVGISASKVIGLIGALFALSSGLSMMFTPDIIYVLCGIVVFVLSIILIIAINVFGLNLRRNIPYQWWLLLLVALGLFLFYIILFNVPFISIGSAGGEETIFDTLLNSIRHLFSNPGEGSQVPILFDIRIILLLSILLLILACVLQTITERDTKTYVSSKIVVVFGGIWAIVESVLLILSSNIISVIIGIIGIVLAILLILSTPSSITLPYAWWFVLIIGFIYLVLLSPYFTYTIISGVLILVGFVLILMAY
jgi:hypothetical protein